MSGFLLDTNVPSELTRPEPSPRVVKWLEQADDNELYLSVISLGEVVKGIAALPSGGYRDHLQEWLDDTLRPWFEGRILPVTEPIAEGWGYLSGQFQAQGKQVKVADGLIGATALHYGFIVVTRNVKDFSRFGIEVVNPWDAS